MILRGLIVLLFALSIVAQDSRPARDLRALGSKAARAKKTLLARFAPADAPELASLDRAIAADAALAAALDAAFVVETWSLADAEGVALHDKLDSPCRGTVPGLALIDRAGEPISIVDASTWQSDGKWDPARIRAFVAFWSKRLSWDDRVERAMRKYGPIYDPEADAFKDLHVAVAKAAKEKKHVLVLIGGNWCHWCYLLHDEIETRPEIKQAIEESYVLVRVSWERDRRNERVMALLDEPWRFGFPVLVVLDGEGKRLHTQDSGQLASGDRHDLRRVLRFLKMWSPAGIDPSKERR